MNVSSIQAVQPPLASVSQPASDSSVAAAPAETFKPYYYSPALTIDPATGTDVIQIRDSSTGAVTAQYPSEKDLKAYSEKSLKPENPPAAHAAEAPPAPATHPAASAPAAKQAAAATAPAATPASVPAAATAPTAQSQGSILA